MDLPPYLEDWSTDGEYQKQGLNLPVEKFLAVTNLLLANPNLNSTHLFRADILYDTKHILKTKAEKETHLGCVSSSTNTLKTYGLEDTVTEQSLNGKSPSRTVLRRLIPRNTNIDKYLDQSCYFYDLEDHATAVLYVPHVDQEADMPWYHPPIRALDYINRPVIRNDEDVPVKIPSLSLYYEPF